MSELLTALTAVTQPTVGPSLELLWPVSVILFACLATGTRLVRKEKQSQLRRELRALVGALVLWASAVWGVTGSGPRAQSLWLLPIATACVFAWTAWYTRDKHAGRARRYWLLLCNMGFGLVIAFTTHFVPPLLASFLVSVAVGVRYFRAVGQFHRTSGVQLIALERQVISFKAFQHNAKVVSHLLRPLPMNSQSPPNNPRDKDLKAG